MMEILLGIAPLKTLPSTRLTEDFNQKQESNNNTWHVEKAPREILLCTYGSITQLHPHTHTHRII